jgi:hypothetical protein
MLGTVSKSEWTLDSPTNTSKPAAPIFFSPRARACTSTPQRDGVDCVLACENASVVRRHGEMALMVIRIIIKATLDVFPQRLAHSRQRHSIPLILHKPNYRISLC